MGSPSDDQPHGRETAGWFFVGSRGMFAEPDPDAQGAPMLDAMAAHGIKPAIRLEFAFPEAPAALAHQKSSGHVGKIVIRVGS